MTVLRRFSDFLGLHEKLVGRYQTQGIVIPPPPEKSVVGMKLEWGWRFSHSQFVVNLHAFQLSQSSPCHIYMERTCFKLRL